MQVSPWTIYWITRLDAIGSFAEITGIIGAVAAIGTLIGFLSVSCCKKSASEAWDEGDEFGLRCVRNASIMLWIWAVIFVPVAILLPTSKQMAAIIVLPAVINSEAGQRVQEIPDKLLQVLEIKLDEVIESVPKVEEAK